MLQFNDHAEINV